MAIAWRKIASVTTGGKRFFYVGRIKKGKVTVVWNRFQGMWELTLNDKNVAFFKTPIKAKQLAGTL